MRATLHVFTFKAGLLARLAHDLRLTLRSFEATLHEQQLRASFDLRSLVVDGVAHGEQVDAAGLSDHDKHAIEKTIADEILTTRLQPTAAYTGRVQRLADDSYAIEGQLELRGTRRPLPLQITQQPAELVARASFAMSDFGITPYRALAGAIRLADRIDIELRVALDGQEPDALLSAVEPLHLSPLPR